MQTAKGSQMEYRNIETSKYHKGQYRGTGFGTMYAIFRDKEDGKPWCSEKPRYFWAAIRQGARDGAPCRIEADSLRELSAILAKGN
jgi:hypothetical protein